MNPYRIDTSERNILGPLTSLRILYDRMPRTSGCEDCEKHNNIKDWCCIFQNPSMYYIDFLNVWQEIQDSWSKQKRKDLILRAVRNFLSNNLSKGCIFYDGGCLIHKQRPFCCRMYGIIPKENWDKRWKELKERQGDKFEALPQCVLVSSDRPVSAEDEDRWFSHVSDCEKRIGVPLDVLSLHDLAGGSYRTFHDHLLIEIFKPEMLEMLSTYRLSDPLVEEIEEAIKKFEEIYG